MTHEEFTRLVYDMRRLQKRFFMTRDQRLVELSKAKEREVDLYLADIYEPNLFSNL